MSDHRTRRTPSWLTMTLVLIGVVSLSILIYTSQQWMEQGVSDTERHKMVEGFENSYQEPAPPPLLKKGTQLSPREELMRVGAISFDAPPPSGKVIGVLRVPRLGTSFAEPIIEGAGKEELDRGVGHLARTALPGEFGNLYLAGHTFPVGGIFHDLRTMRTGDLVHVDTARYRYTYTVYGHDTVLPDEVRVSAPIPNGEMNATPDWQYVTLQTCTPAYDPDYRFVVFGKLTSIATHDGSVVWQ